MAKPRKTPEDVCIEYAIAVAEARRFHAVMASHTCTEKYDPEGISQSDGEECLSLFWKRTQTDNGCIETPEIEYDEMCSNCKVREQAYRDRSSARQRLGAAKRSVEAVGKRLNAAPKSLGETPTVSPKK